MVMMLIVKRDVRFEIGETTPMSSMQMLSPKPHICTLALTTLILSAGCTTTTQVQERTRAHKTLGFLHLDVQPEHATVYINERYQGLINQWLHHTIPVPAGLVRLELRASGHITQRFDVEVGVFEQVTLTLQLIDDEAQDLAASTPHKTQSPRFLPTPSGAHTHGH